MVKQRIVSVRKTETKQKGFKMTKGIMTREHPSMGRRRTMLNMSCPSGILLLTTWDSVLAASSLILSASCRRTAGMNLSVARKREGCQPRAWCGRHRVMQTRCFSPRRWSFLMTQSKRRYERQSATSAMSRAAWTKLGPDLGPSRWRDTNVVTST